VNQFYPYVSAFAAFLVVFLPWELSALRKRRDHVTLSEYVWRFEGRSGARKAGVFVSILGLGFVLAGHLAGFYFK
jgi:hypothetical protein